MSEESTKPRTASTSGPGLDQFQKDKKQKKKFQKNPKSNKFKNIPVQNEPQQVESVSSVKSNCQKEFNISQNLNEFPQLERKNHGVRSLKKNEGNEPKFQKSRPSFDSSRESRKNLEETLSQLSYVDSLKKKKDYVPRKKDESNKISHEQESSDKAHISTTSKKKEEVIQDNDLKFSQSKSAHTQRTSTKKKRADPVLINLKEILEVNKANRKTKQHKTFKSKALRFNNKESLSGNILDSSNPKRNKGKHREIKKKRLTNLKLVILKERILKQKFKENDVDIDPVNKYVELMENINFEEEIVKYVKELNEKKNKIKQGGKDKVKQNTKENIKSEKGDEKLLENKEECKKVDCLKEKNNNCNVEKSNVENVTRAKQDKEKLFSCKVREYCDNLITPALNSAVAEMIKEVVNLQDKTFARDPVKAKAKRRHVSGFREVKKYLNLKKVKMIVISPNLEKLQMKGSVFDLINELKEMSNVQNVPYVFALDRYKLGKCIRKSVPVSAFAILNYEGLEDRFKNVLTHLQEARQQFADRMSKMTLKSEGDDLEKDKEQSADTASATTQKETKSTEENPDEEVSQRISTFLTSLRELSSKNK